MSSVKVIAACLMLTAQTYDIPPAALVGIYKAEGGAAGQAVKNTNDTYDLGPMQINTVWMPVLAERWGVSEDTAMRWVRDDACTNIGVAGWILKGHLEETQSLSQAIAHYHSKTPKHATRYKSRVLEILEQYDLIGIKR